MLGYSSHFLLVLLCEWGSKLAWPCRVMTKTVGERVHTMMWSTFWGFRCTSRTALSEPPSACGGRKEVRQSQVLPSHTRTVLSLDPVITCTAYHRTRTPQESTRLRYLMIDSQLVNQTGVSVELPMKCNLKP